ncbi:MAG: PaaI family thioesterase [Deltaproteobacteria bacterium]|nr:PaaI family thioesterase [Deltaproteobacteria bacterium]
MSTAPELAELVERMRSLIDAAVTTLAPPETLREAETTLRAVEASLRRHVPDPVPPRYTGGATVAEVFPYDPLVGRMSPLAPPVEMVWQDTLAVGTARFGTPYEGPPGCVHGGVLAAVFDQVLNVANMSSGIAGPTKRLEIKYKKPTPLRTELRFEGWVERQEGREVYSAGRVLAGTEVTAEARGVFVRIPLDRVMRMLD